MRPSTVSSDFMNHYEINARFLKTGCLYVFRSNDKKLKGFMNHYRSKSLRDKRTFSEDAFMYLFRSNYKKLEEFPFYSYFFIVPFQSIFSVTVL